MYNNQTYLRFVLVVTYLEFCSSGQEIGPGGDCSDCLRGYYKNNSESAQTKFGQCRMCPAEFITETTGATSESDCNIGQLSDLISTN